MFILLTYVVLPLLFEELTKNKTVFLGYNFFSFPAYILMMLVLFVIFNRKILRKHKFETSLKHKLLFSFLSVCCFIGYYFIRFSPNQNLGNHSYFEIISWTLYVIGTFLIAIAIFDFTIFKKTYNSLFVFALATYIFYLFTQILWLLWGYLSVGVTKILFFIFSLFTSQTSMELGGNPTLTLLNFRVTIGAPCSGVEGASMFIGLFFLLMVYEFKNLHWKRASYVFVAGLAGVYIINIIRVALLVLVGTRYPDFALGVFHSNLGWVLFSGFILALIYVSYNWMKKSIKILGKHPPQP